MEGFSSVNGRASGRTARERSDRKRAKKRSRRDLELRFDDLPSPAYDDSFYIQVQGTGGQEVVVAVPRPHLGQRLR